MGKRGPPPEPSIYRYVRGNPSKKPFSPHEPTPDLLDDLEPPEEIASDDLAVKKWRQSVPVLRRMRVFTEADTDAWTIYCRTWANWMRAKAKCDQFGRDNISYETDANGKTKIKWTQPYTWAVEEKALASDLRRLQQEFGLTPSSRSQVTIHSNADEDPIAAFVKKRSDRAGA